MKTTGENLSEKKGEKKFTFQRRKVKMWNAFRIDICTLVQLFFCWGGVCLMLHDDRQAVIE
jgi:hypothetical protein